MDKTISDRKVTKDEEKYKYEKGDRVKFVMGYRVYEGNIIYIYEYKIRFEYYRHYEVENDKGQVYLLPYKKIICKTGGNNGTNMETFTGTGGSTSK